MFDVEAKELDAFGDVREEFLHELLAGGDEGVAGESLGETLHLRRRKERKPDVILDEISVLTEKLAHNSLLVRVR